MLIVIFYILIIRKTLEFLNKSISIFIINYLLLLYIIIIFIIIIIHNYCYYYYSLFIYLLNIEFKGCN